MFEGFSQETVDFMWGIRFNNRRDWFEAHKSIYLSSFYEPMKALGAELQQRLTERFPESGLNLKISRIYRDARRLFGRGPYKDHLWLSLFRWDQEEDGARPVLWFELSPDGWSYGMGFWCAKAVVMAKHRARMDRNPGPVLELAKQLEAQTEFVLDGPEYSRPKAAPCPELERWYNKKSLAVIHEEPLSELLYSHDLADRLAEGLAFLMPYYDYFSTLWADPDPRGKY